MGWTALSEAHVQAGIQQAQLPGRFQVLGLRSPIAARFATPAPPRYAVLDGAHTGESASALCSTLRSVFPLPMPLVFVVAMAADKEHRAVIDALRAASPSVVIFTSAAIAGSTARSCAPGVLAGHWQSAMMTAPASGGGPRCRQLIQASLPAAIDKAKHELSAFGGLGVVCVTGSLHAVAQASRCLREQGLAVEGSSNVRTGRRHRHRA